MDNVIRFGRQALAALALLSAVPGANAAYLFVTLDPAKIWGMDRDQADKYRIIPVFQTETQAGRKLEPIEGGPILVNGYNVCISGYFCAFNLSGQDVDRLQAGEQFRVLFQSREKVPSLLSELEHDNFYRVADCRPNHRCLVVNDRGYELVGEVLIQDRPEDCIASNTLYRGVLEEALVQLTASMQAAGGPGVPPMMPAGGLAGCVMPGDLHFYLEALASEQALYELQTLAAHSFFAIKRLSPKPLKLHVDEMKKQYLAAAEVEVRSAHAGNVQLKNQDDIAQPKGRQWRASLILPSLYPACVAAVEQLAELGESKVGECQ